MKKNVANYYTQNYASFVGFEEGLIGVRNKYRVNKFTKLINPKKNDRILEIGCNRGLLLLNLANYSKNVVGIDINKKQIDIANDKRMKYMSATNLKFSNNHFDKICAFEVVEHVEKIDKLFSEVNRVLKSKGLFYISFPFELIRGQNALFDSCMIYKNPFFARKLHVHKLFPSNIKKIADSTNFKIVCTKLVFIPFPSFFMILKKI